MSNFFTDVFDKNSGTSVMPGFNFILRVEGAIDCPCRAIKGLRREYEYDQIQEGGLNDYVHLKRKPISKPFTFQVERYAGLDYLDPLALGTELTLPLILGVFDRPTSAWSDPRRCYVFTGCTVMSKEYGDFNAESSNLLVETVTIAYRQMACIDNWSERNELFGEKKSPSPSDYKKANKEEMDKDGKPKYIDGTTDKETKYVIAKADDENILAGNKPKDLKYERATVDNEKILAGNKPKDKKYEIAVADGEKLKKAENPYNHKSSNDRSNLKPNNQTSKLSQ